MAKASGLAVGVIALALTAAPAAAKFENVAGAVGVEFVQVPDPITDLGDPRILVTSGSAWLDFNGDGLEDLYATQGDGCNKLFRNDGPDGFGGWIFTEVAQGLHAALCDDVSRGVAAADYDNDGYTDIFVTGLDQNRLLHNEGGADFSDATMSAGFDNGGTRTNSSSVSWGDYDGDGFVDLFVGGYVQNLPPDPNVCQPNELWHNDGNGGFTDVAAALGVDLSGDFLDPDTGQPAAACTLAVAMTDYDGDGDPDIMVVNDWGAKEVQNELFRNDGSDGGGGWVFTDVSAPANMNWSQFGMGIGIGDINNDLKLDYYQTTIPTHPVSPAPNVLAVNDGDGTFTNIAEPSGTGLEDALVVNWGAVLFDAENDGDQDLFVASGGAVTGSPMFFWITVHGQPLYAFRNEGNLTFTENRKIAGLTDLQVTRGLTMVDYDNDGAQDLYLGNPDGTNVLYRNTLVPGPDTNWLKVRAVGTVGNRDAIGTRVNILAGGLRSTREIDGGSSFLSMNSKVMHFGLHQATSVDRVVARFRSGLKFEMRDVPANQTLVITEPVVSWTTSTKQVAATVGEPLALVHRLRERIGVERTVDCWIDLVENGTTSTVVGPVQVAVPAHGVIQGHLESLTFDEPTQATLILRTGTYPGEIIHQQYVDVTVTAP